MAIITYIAHSGYLIEWSNCYWLFDYYKGVIPELNPEKKLLVFASHKHGDHFNPEIFRLSDKYPIVEYVLSSDIRIKKEQYDELGVTEDMMTKIIRVKPHVEYMVSDGNGNNILIKTLRSTDCGVAFLLNYKDKTIYHAGDLNDWVWKEETDQLNHNMSANYKKELETVKNVPIDIAFVPLDPRQEEWYYLGLEKLINTARVRYAFPMHFWDQPSIIQKFKQERKEFLAGTEVMDVLSDGQSWELKLD